MDEAALLGEHMLIVCGPSGAGKSTLVRRALERHEAVRLSISFTTRAPRGQEKNGVDYHFVSLERFEEMKARDAFAEWALVHGNYYGTARATIQGAAQRGWDLLFDIDYQGATQLKAAFPSAWSVLVSPPNLATLEARLRGRKTDAEDVILRRLQKAREELEQRRLFDFIVVNDDLERATESLLSIYHAMSSRQLRAALSCPEIFS
ncbi:MAG: guanylate kinase [Deltaproteobacteria bacterium CG2_30_63_29]|nr:MAG: guanylate kinase [Deltaproteobacteria bacterium CG2_30_63_29]PJB38026.1 MAG: guanylate kinase [Deltaproteobacteria bacterium CG_4_9_14_3_um_filter_63_12]